MNEDLILNAEQMRARYDELGNDKDATSPYFYKLTQNSQTLYFVGTTHFADPADPVLERIKKYWIDFLKETKHHPRAVFIEGGMRKLHSDLTTAVTRDGEPGAMVYWAHQADVGVISPEPPRDEELAYLLKTFQPDDIAYYYFARVAAQWYRYRRSDDRTLEQYMEPFQNRMNQVKGLETYDFSFEHMLRLHDERHDHAISIDNHQKCFQDDATPYHSKAAAGSSRYRNIYISRQIMAHWKEGESLFILYGSGHAITLEKALVDALK